MYSLFRYLKKHMPRRVRRVVAPPVRRLLNAPRALPDFVIVGVQKGGTTSLYKYLARHPQVLTATRKEVHFFDTNYDRGLRWYRSHFPPRRVLKHRADGLGRSVITGEASPYYLFHPHALRRLADHLPHAKLIVLLRDPVTRAYSHYQHQIRQGRETLPFEAAVEQEADRLRGERERMLADASYNSYAYQHFSYVARGVYADQLEELYRHVPPERVLLLKSETFFEHTQAVYDDVLRFLGLAPMVLEEPKPYYPGRYGDEIPGEDTLRAYYAPHNRRLYAMTAIDFYWESEGSQDAALSPRVDLTT